MSNIDNLAKDKEYFYLCLSILSFTLIILITSLFYEQGERLYYKANMTLFTLSIINIVLFIKGYERHRKLYKLIKLGEFRTKSNIGYWGDILIYITYFITIYVIIFVIDLEFLQNQGIKIGAVVAISVLKLILDTRKT